MAGNLPTIGSDTNAISLAVAICGTETTNDTIWYLQQPNDIGSFAATLERVARDPISIDRQRRKGAVTNLTAAPAFPMDTTIDGLALFMPIAHYTVWKGPAGGAFGYDIGSVTSTQYVVTAKGDALVERTLVIARGFADATNNGLKMVGSGSTTTAIVTTGLTTASATGDNASLHECGFRFTDGDLEVDADGNLITTTKDFTELPLVVGQYVYIGGAEEVNQFTEADDKGFARITAISANKLTIDNTGAAFAADDGSGKQVDLYYGVWCRNVPVDHADFNLNHMTLEVAYSLPGGRAYEYAIGASMNTLALASPLTDKSTIDFATVTRDVTQAAPTRKLGTFKNFTYNEAFNTSDDIARMRIRGADEMGVTTYFTDATINMNNNASPKNVLGVLGAADVNIGNFEVGESMTTLFTDTRVTQALRNNETVSFELALVNNEGMVVIDQPEIVLGGGDKSFPVNDKVEIALENEAFGSSFGYTESVTLFRFNPEA